MKPCKRIEIVVEEHLAGRMADQLDAAGAPGYTVIRRAGGRGVRGVRRADDPTGTATNCVFIVACDDDAQVEKVVAAIRVMLKRSGGLCLISDAHWIGY
jgi:nitrogen regulatory protein PII